MRVAPARRRSAAIALTRRSKRGSSTVAVAERTTTISVTPRSRRPASPAKRSNASSSARLDSVSLVTSSSPDSASPKNPELIAIAATKANAQPATVSHGRLLLHTANRSLIALGSIPRRRGPIRSRQARTRPQDGASGFRERDRPGVTPAVRRAVGHDPTRHPAPESRRPAELRADLRCDLLLQLHPDTSCLSPD